MQRVFLIIKPNTLVLPSIIWYNIRNYFFSIFIVILSIKKHIQRIASIALFVAIFSSHLVWADNSDFSKINIPLEPVSHHDASQYSEDLFEVTDEGVFSQEGDVLTDFDIDDETVDQENKDDIPKDISDSEDSFEAYRQSLITSWGGKKSFAKKRLKGIKENIEEEKGRFKELEKEISETEEKLNPIREEINSLQGEINLINSHIRITKKKMTNVELMIAEKKIEIKDSMLFLERSKVELDVQKKVVLDYVKLMYQEESKFFDLYNDSSSTVKLLLTDQSISENLLGKEYFKVMEETGRQVFYDLDRMRQEQLEKQKTILHEQAELEYLYNALEKEKKTYKESITFKKDLLKETQGKEEEYQLLLEKAIQEQLESSIAVQNLQENIDLIEGKLDILDDGIENIHQAEHPEDFTKIKEKEEGLNMINSLDSTAEEDNIHGKPFIWPVPANKITAKFHDPTYPKRWGLHQAIDIRAKQYTEIRAPANAYVFQTKDNGMGYSYIILAHKNNLVTVYGHVSKIMVKAGTIVHQGEVIGLSGGMPGTKGAGLQTTGAHLHFEVHYKGKPVNPLNYLPVSKLPIEYVPNDFLEDWKVGL